MNITFHSATEAVRGLLDQIDPETGELPEGYEDARAIDDHYQYRRHRERLGAGCAAQHHRDQHLRRR